MDQQLVWSLLFLLVCGGIANMTPVLVKKINVLNYPIDGGKTWNSKRILGDGKTWRGLVFGTLVAGLVGYLFYYINPINALCGGEWFSLPVWPVCNKWLFFDVYSQNWHMVLGAIIGFSALFGDMVKSFFKRQLVIERGTTWFPFDQLDWIFGILTALLILSVVPPILSLNRLTWSWWYLILVPIGLLLHLIVKWIGFKLKIENKAI
jgi:CDP-2,3-bis-(O-geranylgeranyl)-sn-glycerol synthase